MSARHPSQSYQDPTDSTTPQPTVLIVEDVAQAAKELRAKHEADHRAIQFHLRGLSAALGRYALITMATTAGYEEATPSTVCT